MVALKKTLLIISIISLLIVGCGKEKDSRTLDDFTNLYKEAGYEVEMSDKPMYQLIYAKDAVMFYIGDDVVKIYEYDTKENMEKISKEEDTVFSNMCVNGRFCMETTNDEYKSIFENYEIK